MNRNAELEMLKARRALNEVIRAEESEKIEQYEKDFLAAEEKYMLEVEARQPAPAPPELKSRANITKYFAAALGEGQLDGVERELNQEMNLSGNQMPLEILEATEDFADDVTNAADVDDGEQKTTHSIAARVFARNAVGWLGVQMPTVKAGEQRWPFVTSGTVAAAVAEGTGTEADAMEMTVVTAEPKTIDSSYVVSREALARVGDAQLKALLKNDLRSVLADRLDQVIINGTGTAPQPTGILARMTTTSYPNGKTGANADDAAHTWSELRRIAWNALDDKYVTAESQGRLLVGTSSYQHMRGLFGGNMNNPQLDAIESLKQAGCDVRYSSRLPAPTAQAAANGKKQLAIYTAFPQAVLAPIWNGITIVEDPYSESRARNIKLQAFMLYDLVYTQSASNRISGWLKYEIVHTDKD